MFIAACLLLSHTAHAHLLNMSEAKANIDSKNLLTLELQLDLLAELGSGLAYYQFSQTPPQELVATHNEIVRRLTRSIVIMQKDELVYMELLSIEPPSKLALSDFENNYTWPMTHVRLQTQLLSSAPIRIKFQTSFIFEEPIALTMYSNALDKRKSRWLVAGQTSPVFILSEDISVTGEHNNIDLEESISLSVLWDYLAFGFLHILPGGWDHLLFLLMLYLSANSFKQLVVKVSLFTLAHSITLGLASYRIIEIPALLTETMIALTIFALAIHNLFEKSVHHTRLRWQQHLSGSLSIFAFGLLHGLGFASSLTKLDQPADHFLISLLSFNIGVELGQLLFLLCIALIIGRFKHRPRYQQYCIRPLSIVTSIAIMLWIVIMWR